MDLGIFHFLRRKDVPQSRRDALYGAFFAPEGTTKVMMMAANILQKDLFSPCTIDISRRPDHL
eukprot:6195281-Pleurochrysis_carterae.AAC.1